MGKVVSRRRDVTGEVDGKPAYRQCQPDAYGKRVELVYRCRTWGSDILQQGCSFGHNLRALWTKDWRSCNFQILAHSDGQPMLPLSSEQTRWEINGVRPTSEEAHAYLRTLTVNPVGRSEEKPMASTASLHVSVASTGPLGASNGVEAKAIPRG